MSEELLARARQAHAACDWAQAFESFTHAAEGSALAPDDLERFADAAMWVADFDQCASICEEAFAIRARERQDRQAAGLALSLAYLHVSRGRLAVGVGWFGRAQELLADAEPCLERAQLEDMRGLAALFLQGDALAALEHHRLAADLAHRVGAPGVEAVAALHAATMLTRTGDVAAGLHEVDRIMTAAIAGELDPLSTARVYCNVISLCQALGDVRRAREWSDEATRCSSRPGLRDFPGDCRLHRAELTRLGGAWAHAEVEIERAIPELERWDVAHVAEAWYALGELRRLRGEFDSAQEAFRRAQDLGRNPQPGLAQVRMAQGDEAASLSMLTSALHDAAHDPLRQAQLLASLVEAHLACGDRSAATVAADRLVGLAEEFGTVVLQAAAAVARCLTGSGPEAAAAGRRAVGLWRDAGAPFEAAVAQFALADAYRRGGERGVARVELDTARNAFAALGARWHVEQADVALHRLSEDQPVDRLRRTFVFTDVVNSTRLLAAMGDDAWASVLRWHDDTIRRQLASWNGEEVKQRGGGDGFFLVFDEAGAALAFAAAVQTEFASHRRTSGFAPEIRIGVHEADALRHAGDYSGRGVHEAARIAELAVGNQILASASTAARSARRGPAKTVQLRGLPGTVDVVEIDW